jgi:hypothetical protein
MPPGYRYSKKPQVTWLSVTIMFRATHAQQTIMLASRSTARRYWAGVIWANSGSARAGASDEMQLAGVESFAPLEPVERSAGRFAVEAGERPEVDAEAVVLGGDQLDVLVGAEPELDEGVLEPAQVEVVI